MTRRSAAFGSGGGASRNSAFSTRVRSSRSVSRRWASSNLSARAVAGAAIAPSTTAATSPDPFIVHLAQSQSLAGGRRAHALGCHHVHHELHIGLVFHVGGDRPL